MQVAVMNIVSVVTMANCRMATAWAMDMVWM